MKSCRTQGLGGGGRSGAINGRFGKVLLFLPT
jgi:hypothetical protein